MNRPTKMGRINELARICAAVLCIVLAAMVADAKKNAVVADSATRAPLANATVFDRTGKAVGITNAKGRLPYTSAADYPITIRFLGYRETTLPAAPEDTVFMEGVVSELQEVVVESRQHKLLHMLAYVREYSTLTTYTDTVFLFREKMVDYMLSPDRKVKFKEWHSPRILKTKSYYRFTNAQGLDSVSDACRHHFSWSDWISIPEVPRLTAKLAAAEAATDTVFGKYSATETWTRNHDHLTIDVDVLADTTSRRWVPKLSLFFRDNLDFERFNARFNYDNIIDDTVMPTDLTGYTFNIESNGRGHSMFRFNRIDEPFFVSTYAEVYIMDKEYITVKEARKWEKRSFDTDSLEILEPMEAPELQPAIRDLIARVDRVDHDAIRLDVAPDRRMMSKHLHNNNFKIGYRALNALKDLLGISSYKLHRNANASWSAFRRSRTHPTPSSPN